jgi:SAM-dependent methyltransferase
VRADLPSLLPLICPACRTRTERGREMHTLALEATFRAAPDGDVEEGALRCENDACRRRYPIVDGIPIVFADAAAHLARFGVGLVERDFDPQTAALLAQPGPDDAPYPWLIEHLSIYLDAHWGDRAEPRPDGPSASFGFEAFAARLAALPPLAAGGRTVELGCGTGRGLYELARSGALVVGVDQQPAALRRARRLLRGEPLPYARRVAGRHYAPATVTPPPPAHAAVALVCGDALDPPLVPGAFDRVTALNVVDAVPDPARLLSVLDGLCAPGGDVILASPYAWQSGIVAEEHRLGDADPAAAVRRHFTDGADLEARYAVTDEGELPWSLRRDARSATIYRVQWLRVHKPR